MFLLQHTPLLGRSDLLSHAGLPGEHAGSGAEEQHEVLPGHRHPWKMLHEEDNWHAPNRVQVLWEQWLQRLVWNSVDQQQIPGLQLQRSERVSDLMRFVLHSLIIWSVLCWWSMHQNRCWLDIFLYKMLFLISTCFNKDVKYSTRLVSHLPNSSNIIQNVKHKAEKYSSCSYMLQCKQTSKIFFCIFYIFITHYVEPIPKI